MKLYSPNKTFKSFFAHIILLSLSLISLFPLFWMIITSLKSPAQITEAPLSFIPRPIVWRNYLDALTRFPFLNCLKNTVYLVIMNMLGVFFSCPLVAYSFARLEWRGRDFCFILLLSTMMIPFAVTMIPLYILFKNLGWLNTFKPLWIGAFFGSPYYIFLLRQFFMTLPSDLEDAARIDGCSSYGIYWRILLPLIKPALIVVGIFTFLNTWNDFLGPLIYINSIKNYTLTLGLQYFQSGGYGTQWHWLMAASFATISPIIVVFFIFQRYFLQGIVLTGLKS